MVFIEIVLICLPFVLLSWWTEQVAEKKLGLYKQPTVEGFYMKLLRAMMLRLGVITGAVFLVAAGAMLTGGIANPFGVLIGFVAGFAVAAITVLNKVGKIIRERRVFLETLESLVQEQLRQMGHPPISN
ncbi:MAG: hypothetical protein ABSE62_10770 [Chthoniobacteraceae bacterium]|jgi:hypothetical protein